LAPASFLHLFVNVTICLVFTPIVLDVAASVSGIFFARSAAAIAPIAIFELAVDAAPIWLVFRRELHATTIDPALLRPIRRHRRLLARRQFDDSWLDRKLIVVEGARRRGHIVTFPEYARIGVPLRLITIVIGVWWLS